MTIETFGDGGVIVTGDDIQVYRLLAIYGALKIQARTGLKSRFNVLQQARDILTAAGMKPARDVKKLCEQYGKFLTSKGYRTGY